MCHTCSLVLQTNTDLWFSHCASGFIIFSSKILGKMDPAIDSTVLISNIRECLDTGSYILAQTTEDH
jgi:hypothetical protein